MSKYLEEEQPYEEGFLHEYTIKDYLDLCRLAFEMDDAYDMIDAKLYRELRYALQHLRSENDV